MKDIWDSCFDSNAILCRFILVELAVTARVLFLVVADASKLEAATTASLS